MAGVVDWVYGGKRVVRLKSGRPLLGEITGSGCVIGTSVATCDGVFGMTSKAGLKKAPPNPPVDGDIFVATIGGCVKLVFSPHCSDLAHWF